MSKNNIQFQTSFSNDSRKNITKEYNLASDDEILLAVCFLTGHTQYLSGEGKSRVLCTLFYCILSCDSYYAL